MKMHTNTQKEFDREVVQAWTDAGALVGWLTRSESGAWEYLQNRPPNVESLPAFVWQKEAFDAVAMNELPAPSAPFAISLQSTRFKSNRFDELRDFQKLEALDLSHAADLSSKWLNDLAGLRNLMSLDLGATNIKDDAMLPLCRIGSLENLYFGSTAVTDAGLKTLAGLESLKTLYLYNTRLTDDGLKELAVCDSPVETLLLYKTQITDAGVKNLARLQNLQTLGLISTAVTDVSLKKMGGSGFFGRGGFKSLQTIHLSQTQTTQKGRDKLTRRRQGLRILI